MMEWEWEFGVEWEECTTQFRFMQMTTDRVHSKDVTLLCPVQCLRRSEHDCMTVPPRQDHSLT